MTQSMTAYARKTIEGPFGSVTCELRSVNHRYLDLTVKLPEAFSMLEMSFRDCIRQRVARGKVECHLHFKAAKEVHPDMQVNVPFADTLIQAVQKIIDRLPNPAPLNPADILCWPGVLQMAETPNLESLGPLLLELLGEVLTEFITVREREGNEMKKL